MGDSGGEGATPSKVPRLPRDPVPDLPIIFRGDARLDGWNRDIPNEVLGVERCPQHLLDLIERCEAPLYFTFVRMLRWYMDNCIPEEYWDFYLICLHELRLPDGDHHPDSALTDQWWAEQFAMEDEMPRSRGS